MEIKYFACEEVKQVIQSLGRTEDVRFSPSNKRLAVVDFHSNSVVVFDIDIVERAGSREVTLKHAVRISSSSFTYPHGLDFIDDRTIAVASRHGELAIVEVPAGGTGRSSYELSPVQRVHARDFPPLVGSGSVSVIRNGQRPHDILVCNSFSNNVSRHVVDPAHGFSVRSNEIALKKWLDTPDGVSVSGDGKWVAVSNHNGHDVLIYRDAASLMDGSIPAGILRGVYYPHGLRFSADGEYIFVADAGAPYVRVYASDGEGWEGVHHPAASIRTMDEPVFLRGRGSPQEGGPKGLDFDAGMNVLVTTCACQPLAFFDLPAILQEARFASRADQRREARHQERALQMRYELDILEIASQTRVSAAEAQVRAVQAEARTAVAEARAAAAELRAVQAEDNAAHQRVRAEKARARAAKAKAKAARAKARAGFLISGRRWGITSPLSRLYFALRRAN